MANIKWKNPGASVSSEYKGLYDSWHLMHQRACNMSGINPTYSDVTVCDRWKSYDNFFEDMADTWFKGATLDKDSILPGNRVYCKEYCKWVNRSENSKEVYLRLGNPSVKKVQCIETGEIFNSAKEASKKYNGACIKNAANPNHQQRTAGGYHWKYLEVING